MSFDSSSWTLSDAKNPTEKEIDRLFIEAKKHGRLGRLVTVLCYNGAFRVSELVHLKASNFNFATGNVRFVPLKKSGLRRTRKGGVEKIVDRPLPAPVEYPLPEEAIAVVREWIRTERLDGDSWLLPGRSGENACHIMKLECPGGHRSKRSVQLIFDEILGAAGAKVPGRGIHSLKHARLTDVARETKDPWMVKEAGRHASITMSDKYVRYVDFKARMKEVGGRS